MEEEFDDEDGDDGDGEVVASLGASEETSSGVTREAEDCFQLTGGVRPWGLRKSVSCDVNPESWELLLRVTGAEADVIGLLDGARVPVGVT